MPDAPIDSLGMLFNPGIAARFADCGVAVLDSPQEVTAIALNYLGHSPYSEDPDALDEVEALLNDLKPHVRYINSIKPINDLAEGEICASLSYSGDASISAIRAAETEADKKFELLYSIPKEGTVIWFDVMTTPVGCPASRERASVHRLHATSGSDGRSQQSCLLRQCECIRDSNSAGGSPDRPRIYSPDEVRAKLFADKSLPTKQMRKHTRLRTRFRSGARFGSRRRGVRRAPKHKDFQARATFGTATEVPNHRPPIGLALTAENSFMTAKHTGDNAFTAEDLYGTSTEPMFAGALSFVRRRYSRDLKDVDLAVMGVPLDTATTNRPGARFGPRAVRTASTNIAWARHWPWEFDPFERLAVVDYGDCLFDPGRPETVPATIEATAQTILDNDTALLTLGGDHFISYPLLRAHAKKHGPLSLLHFDAHSDTWEDEAGRIDHGTMFYHAAKEGIVDPSRSVQVGLRTTNDKTLGFNILDANAVHAHSAKEIAEKIRGVLGDNKVYLTFDIDCLDPAFAPGTGTPVCGGLATHKALEILRLLRGINLVGMDLVEVAPAYDVGEITALAGATLALEFICLYADRHAPA